MISASLPGVFLFVQQGALRLIRTVVHFVAMLMGNVCLALLRAMITCVVFATCTLLMLYYLGLPVPAPADLFHKLQDLGRLARILS